MPRVNLLLKPKGGVGKNFVAAIIAEHKAMRLRDA